MPRVVHFEIAADNTERAAKFYADVFGWNINKWDEQYWLISTGERETPGIDGGLMKKMENFPGVINTIDVDSVDEYAEKITNSGGAVVVPKMAIPNVGFFAYCRDTEGNIFGIMQNDPTAQ
ncbi:MAG: VOC family protein [Chlorobi bacterium CHB2]|nr:VOC family protein [Chlorobi bacterium CHB2]